jgi:hypothetical protein
MFGLQRAKSDEVGLFGAVKCGAEHSCAFPSHWWTSPTRNTTNQIQRHTCGNASYTAICRQT